MSNEHWTCSTQPICLEATSTPNIDFNYKSCSINYSTVFLSNGAANGFPRMFFSIPFHLRFIFFYCHSGIFRSLYSTCLSSKKKRTESILSLYFHLIFFSLSPFFVVISFRLGFCKIFVWIDPPKLWYRKTSCSSWTSRFSLVRDMLKAIKFMCVCVHLNSVFPPALFLPTSNLLPPPSSSEIFSIWQLCQA